MSINLREYGDLENLKSDAKIMHDILNRQGTNFVVDCIADYVGFTVNKFELFGDSATRIKNSLINELKEAINERI